MHFLITALGSYGDVYPFVGLGAALRARGHEVAVITNPYFQDVVEGARLDFLAIGKREDYQRLTEIPHMWHPILGPIQVMRKVTVKILRELYSILEANYRPAETVLVAHMLDMSSRVFQEKHGAPLASVQLAPLMLRSFEQSSRYGTLLMGDRVPRWLRRTQFWMADRLVIDRIIGPELNTLRGDLGLGRVKFIMREWWFSPQLVLGLFPEWYASPQPDWPPSVRVTGFPLWDETTPGGLSPEVEEFLAEGGRPIVFTPGSAMSQGEPFFQAAVEACEELGRRGILLTKYPGQLPQSLPGSVRYFDYLPFSLLLPRVAALVHHGGIGTCAQGLAAGVPQLLMPMAYDQPDNAARLERLGVARALSKRKFRGPNVAHVLGELVEDPEVQTNCRRLAGQCDGRVFLERACELLEQLGEMQQ